MRECQAVATIMSMCAAAAKSRGGRAIPSGAVGPLRSQRTKISEAAGSSCEEPPSDAAENTAEIQRATAPDPCRPDPLRRFLRNARRSVRRRLRGLIGAGE